MEVKFIGRLDNGNKKSEAGTSIFALLLFGEERLLTYLPFGEKHFRAKLLLDGT